MDVDLHYREQGTGEPLILLHGNGEDGSYFEHQMDAFASRFRVIALDTRGHGRSPRGEAPFTIRQFADDLLAFMWAFRDAVDACRIPHIVSTRAIGKCYKKELAGIDRETILRTNVIRSLSQDDLNVVIGAMKGEGASEHNPYYAQITAMRVEK